MIFERKSLTILAIQAIKKHIKRLIQLISEVHKKPVDQIREIVIKDVREFIGSHKVYDDITFMVMKRKI